ncbi:MAG: hypothetical protein ACYS91_18400, partial [Planctomycetota bacterium]
ILRLTIVFFCCCLTGCHSCLEYTTIDFEERQRQLFYEIDHEAVYESCQELMCLDREGKLSDNTFSCDDPKEKKDELPDVIRLLEPAYVHVQEIIVQVGFLGEDNVMQVLICYSNEFGQPPSVYGDAKGWGWRSDPFGMDDLTGKETLDELNAKYDDFEMELIQGLDYHVFREEEKITLNRLKEGHKVMDMLLGYAYELAVKKQRLLYQTDHKALLKACREAIARYNDGVFSTDKIDIIGERFTKDLKNIPEIIMNLEPVYVWLYKDHVMVALIGGLDHAGVVAYMNNGEANTEDEHISVIDGHIFPKPVDKDRDIKLIDGLLYYDDGLREGGEKYKEYLKSLEKEALRPIDWNRKEMGLPIPDRGRYRK